MIKKKDFKQINTLFKDILNILKDEDRKKIFTRNEQAVKCNFIASLLHLIGWNLSDPLQVEFEYPIGDRDKIDIVLKYRNTITLILEVKKLNILDSQTEFKKARDQLLKYLKVEPKYLGLTDGVNWYIYSRSKTNTPIWDLHIDLSEGDDLNINESSFLKFLCLLACLMPTEYAINELEECLITCKNSVLKLQTTTIDLFWEKLMANEYSKNKPLKETEDEKQTSNKQYKIYGKRNLVLRFKIEDKEFTIKGNSYTSLIKSLIETLLEQGIFKLETPPQLKKTKYKVYSFEENELGARPIKISFNGKQIFVNRGGTNKDSKIKYISRILKELLNVKEAEILDKTNNENHKLL